MLDGRREAVADIDKHVSLVNQAGKRGLRPLKIMQLTAPPRSGKSSLLEALDERYTPLTPVGRYSFKYSGTDVVHSDKALDLLMQLLSAPRKEVGELTFPRLQSTRVAVSQAPNPAPPTGLSERAKYFARLLEDPQSVDLVNQIVSAAVSDASKMLPPGLPGSGTATIAMQHATLGGMRRIPWGRKKLSPLAKSGLGPWAGMINGPRDRDLSGMDAVYYTLACIAPYRDSKQKALIEQAETQPWLAFLADIQAGYVNPRRTTSAILLLDDIDLPAGMRFLDSLAKAAAEHQRHGSGTVPLLVIAMGRHPIVQAHDFFETRQLKDLSRDEVGSIVRRRPTLPGLSAAEDAVPVLSAGHRGIAEDMLDQCAALGTYPFDLTRGVPLRGRLLHNVDAADFTALVGTAPALEVGQVELANLDAEASGLPPPQTQRTEVRRILQEHGWLLPHGAIHPAIRYLLLRRLADDGNAWRAACLRLRDHPPDVMRLEGRTPVPRSQDSLRTPQVRAAANRAYYDLASGDVGAAVASIEGIRGYEQEWVTAFDWVTSAPQPYGVRYEPRDLADGLISYWLEEAPRAAVPVPPVAAPLMPPHLVPAPPVPAGTPPTDGATMDPIRRRLTELVVSCWLGADRQLDPFHELDQNIADAYRQARPLGAGIFVERGEVFRDWARNWRRDEHDHQPRPIGAHAPCER
jgi:hypothetical protein